MRLRNVVPVMVLFAVIAALIARQALAGPPIELPPGFVHLKGGGEGFRARTSDEARLWLRTLTDPSEAPIEFWAEVLEKDLLQRGYERRGGGEVRDGAGAVGRWLEFDANVQGERMHYRIAVWVDGTAVRVVEYGAVGEAYGKHLPAVEKALTTLRR